MSAQMGDNSGGVSAEHLRSLVERIERMEEERKGFVSNIKDIFTESASAGFDVKVMKRLIKLRRIPAAEADEQDALLETYRRAVSN